MKTYYEILEIDKNASDEVIKNAYKTLVKKYHPDLKTGQEKVTAEKKTKEINSAYDVLSNPTSKAEYDQSLSETINISIEEYKSILNENNNLKNELNYYKDNFNNFYNINNAERINKNYTYRNERTNQYNNTTTEVQNQNNINNDENPDYNTYSKSKFILNRGIKNIIAILLTFLVIFIILKIPFVNQFVFNLFSPSTLFILILVIVGYFYFFQNKQQ